MKSLCDCGEQKRGLHHCEPGSDAYAWAAPKGEIGVAREAAASNRVILPAVRVKSFRFRVETSITLSDPLSQEHVCAGQQLITMHLKVLQSLPPDNPGWRVQAHGFLHYHFGIGQRPEIRNPWCSPVEHMAELIS